MALKMHCDRCDKVIDGVFYELRLGNASLEKEPTSLAIFCSKQCALPLVGRKDEPAEQVKVSVGCEFNMAWRGRCNEHTVKNEEYCVKHMGLLCSRHKAQATRDCSTASQFVCGAPLCKDCHECWNGSGH